MKLQFKRTVLATSIATGISGVSTPALAQTGEAAVLEEIVVSARRREESLQQVPLTVNAVSGEQIADLNIRHFEDLQAVVPGLTLAEDSLAPNASMRGVKYDTFASGNNATVEFYLNDAPVSSASIMQAMFDVSQVEVLHGPQGTLRGRASPSGSITVTTAEPSLEEFEGHIEATTTDTNSTNINGAVSIPIEKGVLGVRLAAFWEENDMYEVENLRGEESSYEGEGYRITGLLTPTDALRIKLYYQNFKPERQPVYQVESAYRTDPTKAPPAFSPDISASDRLGVSFKEQNSQEHERVGFEFSYEFSGQVLKYVYSDNSFTVKRKTPDESGDVTGALLSTGNPETINGFYNVSQEMVTGQDSKSQELRLQSTEPLWGVVDYVIGAFKYDNIPTTELENPVALTEVTTTTPNLYGYSIQNITSINKTFERSYFGNLTFHLTDATELSVGGRYIEYEEERLLDVGVVIIGPGSLFGDDGLSNNYADIFSASLKHEFTDSLMVYASYGESWRGPAAAIGDFSIAKSQTQLDFDSTEAEESESFELGIRSTWLDNRLRLNGTIYKQSFDNYVYRAPGDGVYYVNYSFNGSVVSSVGQHNFISGVPIEVKGIELEASYLPTNNFEIGAVVSYSKGEIDDGTIPCNDLDGDGKPDAYINGAPSVGQLIAITSGENVSACDVDFRANDAPLWTANLSAEYSMMIGPFDSYVRGLWTFYGKSDNDPINPLDDVAAYDILNLYFGVRDPGRGWDAKLFVNNVLDTEEVLEREQFPGSLSYISDGTPVTLNSDYRKIQITKQREIGINVRYNF